MGKRLLAWTEVLSYTLHAKQEDWPVVREAESGGCSPRSATGLTMRRAAGWFDRDSKEGGDQSDERRGEPRRWRLSSGCTRR